MFEHVSSCKPSNPPEGVNSFSTYPHPAIDEDLVARAKIGDQEAIADVYLQVWPIIQGAVDKLVADVSHAEELALGALEKVLIKGIYGDSYHTRDSFAGWANTVARNYTLDDYRQRARNQLLSIAHPAVQSEMEERAQSPDTAILALEADSAQRINATFAAAGIEDKFKQPFLMYYLGKLPASDISAALGVNYATVRTRIHRAEQKLKAHYGITNDSRLKDIFTYSNLTHSDSV